MTDSFFTSQPIRDASRFSLKYFALLHDSPRQRLRMESNEEPKKLSKKQLKKLAKHGTLKKKEKPKWNIGGVKATKSAKKLNLNQDEVLVNKTPPGEKKDLSGSIAEKYNPEAVEAAWDLWWEKKGYYKCSAEEVAGLSPEEKFVMVIPPPNVTGKRIFKRIILVILRIQ